MDAKISKKWFKKYKWLRSKGMKHDAMCWGFQCESGWANLLDVTFKAIDVIVKREKLKHFRVNTVKEKFGGLRIYTDASNDAIEALIDKAGDLSYKICEECGSTEEVETWQGGWVRTLCLVCAKKSGKYHTKWKYTIMKIKKALYRLKRRTK